MPKSKLQKQSTLEKIKQQIASAKAVVFTDYKGSKMKELQELRKNIKDRGGKFEITKITLVKLAFGDGKLKDLVGKASLALGYSSEDEIGVPKEIKKFGKTNPNIKILGGFYEGRFLTAEEMSALADIPSKEELIVKLLGMLKSPMYGLVGNLGGLAPKLVRTLQVIVGKGE